MDRARPPSAAPRRLPRPRGGEPRGDLEVASDLEAGKTGLPRLEVRGRSLVFFPASRNCLGSSRLGLCTDRAWTGRDRGHDPTAPPAGHAPRFGAGRSTGPPLQSPPRRFPRRRLLMRHARECSPDASAALSRALARSCVPAPPRRPAPGRKAGGGAPPYTLSCVMI